MQQLRAASVGLARSPTGFHWSAYAFRCLWMCLSFSVASVLCWEKETMPVHFSKSWKTSGTFNQSLTPNVEVWAKRGWCFQSVLWPAGTILAPSPVTAAVASWVTTNSTAIVFPLWTDGVGCILTVETIGFQNMTCMTWHSSICLCGPWSAHVLWRPCRVHGVHGVHRVQLPWLDSVVTFVVHVCNCGLHHRLLAWDYCEVGQDC